MTQSMTGYGRGEGEGFGKRVIVELKSVNHRYMDIIFRMPKIFLSIEDRLKKTIQQKISRGRVEVYVTLEQTEDGSDRSVLIDKNLLITYYKEIEKIRNELNIDEEIGLQQLLSLQESVIITDRKYSQDEFAGLLENTLDTALDTIVEMRTIEGNRLIDYIKTSLEKVEGLFTHLEERAPFIPREYKRKLEDRIKELLPKEHLDDDDRIFTESAFFADKSDITEEINRLKSHFQTFWDEISGDNGPIGRKLDFLIQEINREINTIGSKANDLVISNTVINMKTEMEKIREQMQNIE